MMACHPNSSQLLVFILKFPRFASPSSVSLQTEQPGSNRSYISSVLSCYPAFKRLSTSSSPFLLIVTFFSLFVSLVRLGVPSPPPPTCRSSSPFLSLQALSSPCLFVCHKERKRNEEISGRLSVHSVATQVTTGSRMSTTATN